jgi:hypothetical protein
MVLHGPMEILCLHDLILILVVAACFGNIDLDHGLFDPSPP